MYWMSAKIPNDQFLLYCFDTPTGDASAAVRSITERASRVPDLRLRVQDVPWGLDYPVWVNCDVRSGQAVEHPVAGLSWDDCRSAIGGLLATALDVTAAAWRLHIFHGVLGAPGGAGTATVVVLQISHALADGRRAAAIARALFGSRDLSPIPNADDGPGPTMLVAKSLVEMPFRMAKVFQRSFLAARAYRTSLRLVEQGELPPPVAGRDLTVLNAKPDGRHEVRIIVCPVNRLKGSGITVTVGALTAVSSALSRYLKSGVGEVPDRLGAEVTVADAEDGSRNSGSRNNFHNIGVDLFPDESDLLCRARKIASALEERRSRSSHPAITAQGATLEVLPAPFVRAGVKSFDVAARPSAVSGNLSLIHI